MEITEHNLYRHVYNNYVTHNWADSSNSPILPSWPKNMRHFREWLTFPTTGLKIHVIRTNRSNTSTVPMP